MLKKLFFAGILKVNDENSRIRIQPDPNPDPNPDPDQFVRDMDPRIRIRIHPKMSWIRNTAKNPQKNPPLINIWIMTFYTLSFRPWKL